MGRIRVLIADGQELSRAGLARIIDEHDALERVGEIAEGKELLFAIGKEDPDVVLIDHCSDGFAIDTVPKVLEKFPYTRFVAITPDRSGVAIHSALRSGIMSYIKKDCSIEEIRNAIIDTANGQKFFCGKILEAISEVGLDLDRIEREHLDCEAVSLSERESEIIKLIAEGHTNHRIAEKLFISDHTVTTHRKNIMKKLGVRNTAGIVLYAVKMELVSPNRFYFAGVNDPNTETVKRSETDSHSYSA
ncbi:MAG: response regulator transcription factor [Flavobacteriales bacterium]